MIMDALAQNKNPIKEVEMGGLLKIEEQHKIDNKYFSIFLDISPEQMVERIKKR